MARYGLGGTREAALRARLAAPSSSRGTTTATTMAHLQPPPGKTIDEVAEESLTLYHKPVRTPVPACWGLHGGVRYNRSAGRLRTSHGLREHNPLPHAVARSRHRPAARQP